MVSAIAKWTSRMMPLACVLGFGTSFCRIEEQVYYFSLESEGQMAEAIPEGFEIYENPNAQVFLRRIPLRIIMDEERQVVEDGMRKYAQVQDYKIDVKGN